MKTRTRQRQFEPADLFISGLVCLGTLTALTPLLALGGGVNVSLGKGTYVLNDFSFFGGAAIVFGIFSLIYLAYPKMVGREMSKKLGIYHFLLTSSGVVSLGLLFFARLQYQAYQVLLLALGLILLLAGQAIFLVNFSWTILKGSQA